MTIKETIEEAKKVGVKDMSWKAWFMIVTIISAAAVASFYGVNVTMNIDLANRVDTLEGMLSHTINSTFYTLQKEPSCTISIVTSGATTYYCVQNGTTGVLDSYSTTFLTVWNYVMTTGLGVTGGEVLIKACASNYIVTGPLTDGGRSNVVVYIQQGATLWLNNNVDDCMFNITCVSNWTFTGGGTLDGNNLGQTDYAGSDSSISHGINIFNYANYMGTNYLIENLYITNFTRFGIQTFGNAATSTTNNVVIRGCTVKNCHWNLINIAKYSQNVRVSDNDCSYAGDVGIAIAAPGTNCRYIIIDSNIVHDITLDPVYGATSNDWYGIGYEGSGARQIIITNNIVYNVQRGIFVTPTTTDGHVVIDGNTVTNITRPAGQTYETFCIGVKAPDAIISNNMIYIDSAAYNYFGIMIGADGVGNEAHRVLCIGNHINGVASANGTVIENSNDVIFSDNILYVTGWGVKLKDTVDRCMVIGNRFISCSKGIDIDDATDDMTFLDSNSFYGCTDALEDNSGPDTVFGSNMNATGSLDTNGSTL